jgi:hypothetical protein
MTMNVQSAVDAVFPQGLTCPLFEREKVGIMRFRFSSTQGELAISYNGLHVIRCGDKMGLINGEWVGLSDDEIIKYTERVYKYGCKFDNIPPLHELPWGGVWRTTCSEANRVPSIVVLEKESL